MRRGVCIAIVLMLMGCAQQRDTPTASPARETPSAEEALRAHNQRVALLDRVWARAVITLEFTDADGDERWEQGNGFFQLLDGDKLALSIGKVGEVLVWIGADSDRYWVLDRLEAPVASFGRHDALTAERLRRAGLPVPPRQLLHLAGLRSIDPSFARISIDQEDRTVVTVADSDGAWRYFFEPEPFDDLPLMVERVDRAGNSVLRAIQQAPKRVRMERAIGLRPRLFSRLRVRHVGSGDMITIQLDGEIEDGRSRGVPRPQVFDLDVLLDAYGPFERVIDLDTEGS